MTRISYRHTDREYREDYRDPSTSSTSPITYIFKRHRNVTGIESRSKMTITTMTQALKRMHFGEIASPYLTPYLYNRHFLDKQYGLRRDDSTFMIGDSTVSVDKTSDTTIKGKRFKATKGLLELLTRKKKSIPARSRRNDIWKFWRWLTLTWWDTNPESFSTTGYSKKSQLNCFKRIVTLLWYEKTGHFVFETVVYFRKHFAPFGILSTLHTVLILLRHCNVSS